MSVQTFVGTLAVETCPKCGMHFGIPTDYQLRRRRDHEPFFCPAGHSQYYPQRSDLELARDEAVREKQRREQAEADAQYQRERRDAAERRVSAARGQVTRIKNRVGAGVCPCCNRTFAQLAAHMATKHPGYRPATTTETK